LIAPIGRQLMLPYIVPKKTRRDVACGDANAAQLQQQDLANFSRRRG